MQINGLYEEKYMSYQILKLIVYLFSILSSMYGLSCFHYEKYILKGKLKQLTLISDMTYISPHITH
jgi:uncharacterized membrane protein YwzB